MKSVSAFSLLTSAAIFLSACSQGSEGTDPDPITPDPEIKKIEIKISPSVSESRATDYGFEAGDCIGLYVVNYNGSTPGSLIAAGNHVDNMRFTYNGSWIPDSPIYWIDNTTHADFYLYYPYADVQSVSAYPFTVKADQSVESAYKASDLMVGKATNIAPTASATVIPASHVMSRIMINLEAGNGFTKESLASAAVSVRVNGVKCGATVNLATGAVVPTGEATAVIPFAYDNSYKALIVPQTVAEGDLITVTVDGTDFNFRKGFTFESGKNHKFTITLSKTSNGVNVNINPWNDDNIDNGGTAE